jgi:hypothetical protein
VIAQCPSTSSHSATSDSNFSETAVPEPSLLTETENVILDGDTIEALPN